MKRNSEKQDDYDVPNYEETAERKKEEDAHSLFRCPQEHHYLHFLCSHSRPSFLLFVNANALGDTTPTALFIYSIEIDEVVSPVTLISFEKRVVNVAQHAVVAVP